MHSLTIIGAGRIGRALANALREQGITVHGPHGRGAKGEESDVVLLCVPDGAIADAAAQVVGGRLVGHCSGATTLAPLAPHEAFSMHPLMTVVDDRARFTGAGCAIAGATRRATETATELATLLGMRPVTVRDEDRALYHAAASIASNHLVTIEGLAEALFARAGVPRDLFVPLVRASVESWADHGAARALTGPIARKDEETVRRHRSAMAAHAADALGLWDALTERTRVLAATGSVIAER
jgi:predicted short-subunit dehydrogenase-like oxidoreductase (DUF2520 family)